ncbi:MAG: DNA-binding transcriptional regulator [Pirellulaceae bacterium]|nr:DNA-binding transcriptional regulator [Pirellulaceae bacterium]
MKLIRIGLAVNHSYSFYRSLLRGVAQFAETRPQWVFTSIIPAQQSSNAPRGRFRPDGLIASIHSESTMKTLANWRCPVVNASSVLPGSLLPRVGVNNTCVGQLAAAHFLERGLRHFAFFGSPDSLFSIERRDAFCHVLQAAGYSVSCHFSPPERPYDQLDRRWDIDLSTYRWLRGLPTPIGLFVPSDHWGFQLSQACHEVDLRMPEDVALLGVDDDDVNCELARPRLSSVVVPAVQIGYEAASLLDRLLAGEKPPDAPILIPPSGIATRRSTEVLAIDDVEVIAAVRFIREHAHLPIDVSDVLREVALGRRTLERRCLAALGWGLAEEIRRAHRERACRLLARTDLSIDSVAQQAGYSGFRHMSVDFRRKFNMTPTAYRRQMRGPSA